MPMSHRLRIAELLPLLLACGAFVLLHGRSLISPVIFYDDFPILAQSRTWQRTCTGLWLPQNEHAMPLGRLFCFGLEVLAGPLPRLPFLTCLVGPGALLLGLGLLYVFVRRELGYPFYAQLLLSCSPLPRFIIRPCGGSQPALSFYRWTQCCWACLPPNTGDRPGVASLSFSVSWPVYWLPAGLHWAFSAARCVVCTWRSGRLRCRVEALYPAA